MKCTNITNILSSCKEPIKVTIGLSLAVHINTCKPYVILELNEEICQDKLINNNYTCCKAECCSRTNGGQVFCTNYNFELDSPNINNPRILTYDREEYFDDPRRKFSTYCNEYDMYAYNYNNQKLSVYKVNYTYEDLNIPMQYNHKTSHQYLQQILFENLINQVTLIFGNFRT